MRTKTLVSLLLLAASFCFISSCALSRGLDNDRMKARVDSLVAIHKITFKPAQALPVSYKPVVLSYGYDLSISKDTVRCYLPYYGKAYTATYGGLDDAGIKFTSNNFEYKKELTGKGAYKITIRPSDTKKKFLLHLTIQPSGYASLQVTDPDRQAISFYGTIDY